MRMIVSVVVGMVVGMAVAVAAIVRSRVIGFCMLRPCIHPKRCVALAVWAGEVVVGLWGGRRHEQL